MSEPKKTKLTNRLANPSIFAICCAWLIVLTVVGTIDQRNIGLYLAQERYFSSWLLWWQGMPCPGGRLTMTVMACNLFFKLAFTSTLNKKRLGTLIAHIGTLMLLLGGIITAYFSNEGSMVLPEGTSNSTYEDYHLIEFAVIDQSSNDFDEVTAFSQAWLASKSSLSDSALPFTIAISNYSRNATATRHQGTTQSKTKQQGFAKNFKYAPLPLEKEHSNNLAGIEFTIAGLDDDADGNYLLMENMQVDQTVVAKGKTYKLVLRRKNRPLPFAIHLLDFEKQVYPGTTKARSFKSVVMLNDGDISRKVTISMNEPLRHRGYTFYQSSFYPNAKIETSVLAVVENAGRMFPYISSIIMCIGLLIHMLIQLPVLISRRKDNNIPEEKSGAKHV